MMKVYDAVVIGAGHAGAEAAHALAKLNKKTLLTTLSAEAVAFMACNPNIGGTAKGHLVKEIDALGGIMGEIADKATIQVRMLNRAGGEAVHSLRAQVDKNLYHRLMKERLEETPNLDVLETEITDILFEDGAVTGVTTAPGDVIKARAVVIATGVYLDSRIITGGYERKTGPAGFMRSETLGKKLAERGIAIRRFKTGTPMRVLAGSVDFDEMELQPGEEGLPTFSALTEGGVRNDCNCYLTYTNAETHRIILSNLDRAPLYNGNISGIGPRYCPSIETKVVRFKDKERHQIFVEPEGTDTREMYIQGMSTSLPFDVQEQMLHTVKGLTHAKITRYGYAIEYDCMDPKCLNAALGVKGFSGLYAAGQINGSSGYEEAAAQGLIAGINAARYLDGAEPVVLTRDAAYTGVLIDDLVTKGTEEPYRMMTSRAEYRLRLRQDNADIRLMDLAHSVGMADEKRYVKYLKKKEEIAEIKALLPALRFTSDVVSGAGINPGDSQKTSFSATELIKMGVKTEQILLLAPELERFMTESVVTAVIDIKYAGYLEKEEKRVREEARLNGTKIPEDIDYSAVGGLRIEAREKLDAVRPMTVGQASRISGVNSADITVLLIYLKKFGGGSSRFSTP